MGVSKLSDIEKAVIVGMYNQRDYEGNHVYTTGQIAKELGRSTEGIRAYLKKLGLHETNYEKHIPEYDVKPRYVEETKMFKGEMLIADEQIWWDWTEFPRWGIESPKLFKFPEWKQKLQDEGVVNYGREYDKKKQ